MHVFKIDLRILTVVACFMVIAASSVVIARYAEKGNSSFVAEKIPPEGAASSEQLPIGLMLQVGADKLTLALPSCDTRQYRDKFFLHAYTASNYGKSSPRYENMDFDLAREQGRAYWLDGKQICVFDQSFHGLAVKEVNVGQFTTPGGRCCNIVWSRSFLVDADLQKK